MSCRWHVGHAGGRRFVLWKPSTRSGPRDSVLRKGQQTSCDEEETQHPLFCVRPEVDYSWQVRTRALIMELSPSSWSEVFSLETPLLELLARGSVFYFGILVLMRFMPRRTGGELTTMDLIFIILIAEAASHALGSYESVADGLVLVLVLMAWNYGVNALSYRFRFIERLTSAPPLQVIRDGQLIRRNMRREFLTEQELVSESRQQGIDDFKKIKLAVVEPDGKITCVQHKA